MLLKVVKGSFAVLIAQIIPQIATLIATPFVIRYLGTESYGILLLLSVITSYLYFADLGMGLASTKFGAEAYGLGYYEKEGDIIKAAAFLAFCSMCIICLIMVIGSEWILTHIFNITQQYIKYATLSLQIALVTFFLTLQNNILNTVLLSRLNMGLYSLIQIISRISMTLLVPVILYYGGGIVGAVSVSFFTTLFTTLAYIIISGNLIPNFYNIKIRKDLFKPLLKFGTNTILYGIGLMIINNLEKVILTIYISVKSLSYYSIAFTFVNIISMFSMAMIQSLIPAFSQLFTPDKKEQLHFLFSSILKINIIALIPSLFFLLVIAEPFFTIWAGKEFGQNSVFPFYILLWGIFFHIIAYIPNCILISLGRTDIFAKVYFIEIVPFALLTVLLVSYFGINGAALSWTLREFINSVIFSIYFKKTTDLSLNIKNYVPVLISGTIVFLPPILLALLWNNFSIWLILLYSISFTLYCLLIWKKLMTEQEKSWIFTKFSFS